MKECPYCGELLGDDITKCFNCFFEMTDPEKDKKALQERKAKEAKEAEERKLQQIKAEGERKLQQIKAEEERKLAIKAREEKILTNNNLYEYKVITVMDLDTGVCNEAKISQILSTYANEGWRLHTIYTNEIGKTQRPQALAIGSVNATIGQTIIVLERIISKNN